jgi:hypothetical protein
VRKKSLLLWLVVLLAAFAVMSGGCGGGGGGGDDSASYNPGYPWPVDPVVPDPVAPDPVDPGQESSFTQEDVDESWAVIDDAYKNVFVENGVKVDALDFDIFAGRIVNVLKNNPAVSDVKLNRGDPVEDSVIEIELKSGLTHTICFSYEESQPFGDVSGVNANIQGNQKKYSPRKSRDSPKTVNVKIINCVVETVARNIAMADILNEDYKTHGEKVNVVSVDLSSYNDSLQQLRTLHGYDFVTIISHGKSVWWQNLLGGSPAFGVPCSPGTQLSAQDLKDLREGKNKRVKIVDEGKIYTKDGRVFVTGEKAEALAVYPNFFTYYYAGEGRLNNSPIVYLASCELGSGDSEMSKAFINAGAAAVIGFDKYVQMAYATVTGMFLFDHLMAGETVGGAIWWTEFACGESDSYTDSYADELELLGIQWGFEVTENDIKDIQKVAGGAALVRFGDEAARLSTGTGGSTPTPTPAPTIPTIPPAPATNGNWSEVADISWYNAKDTSFNLSSAEQLAGLAAIVNGKAESIASLNSRAAVIKDDFSGKTITLTKDIDLGGMEWTPIGSSVYFNGTFDGGGQANAISNLTIDEGSSDYNDIGLFGKSDGSIKNVHLSNVYVSSSSSHAGGIVGFSIYGEIEGCTVNGIISVASSDASSAGGIAGYSLGSIKGCAVSGTVYSSSTSSKSSAGGIVGVSGNVTIIAPVEDCVASGTVFSSKSGETSYAAAGGIVGDDNGFCVIKNCTASAGMDIRAVNTGSGNAYRGGLIGYLRQGTLTGNHNNTGITAIGNDE